MLHYPDIPSYPDRHTMKFAHKLAKELRIDFDSHAMDRMGSIIFIKNKKYVAKYDSNTREVSEL